MLKLLLILFLSACLIHIKSNGQEVDSSNREYRKIVNYIYNGCSEIVPQFRKDSQSLIILIKYYINPGGAVDSIVPSDNALLALKCYIKSMDGRLANWNKVLAPSRDERILAVPLFIGPIDVKNVAGSAYAQRPSSVTKMFSFPQLPVLKFKERLYLMDPLFCMYYARKYTYEVISGK